MPDPRSGHTRAAVAAVLLVAATAAHSVAAQLPALPAAQSAFPAPGLAVAVDGGHADGRTVFGVAGATGVRRLQLTAAVGIPGALPGYDRSGVSAGGRLAVRLYRSTRLGVSGFGGYGVERMRAQAEPTAITVLDSAPAITSSGTRPTGAFTQIPVGVSAGLRGEFGDRPYALSIAPMYAYTRWRISDTSQTRSGARVTALAEIAVTPQIGVGVAGEVGSAGPLGSPYAGRRTVIGAGISYAIRRVVAR